MADFTLTRLSPEDEEKFLAWFAASKWYAWYTGKYGAPPNANDSQYDYRGAWKAGIYPIWHEEHGGYFWADHTPAGAWLKSEDHPRRWIGEFMDQFGYDPETRGINQAQALAMMQIAIEEKAPPATGNGAVIFRAALEKLKGRYRTAGRDLVTAIAGPGEIILAGRPERVLLAGRRLPPIGASIPWVRIDDQTLLASYSLTSKLLVPPAAGVQWEGEYALLGSLLGEPEGIYENILPSIFISADQAYTFLFKYAGTTRRFQIYRAPINSITNITGWVPIAGVDFPIVTDQHGYTHYGGPAWASACVDSDTSAPMFFYQIDLECGRDLVRTDQIMYTAAGTIGEPFTLAAPLDLAIPYVQGFGAFNSGRCCGITKDAAGYYWIVSTQEIIPPRPQIHLVWGLDLPVGWHSYCAGVRTADRDLVGNDYTGINTNNLAMIGFAPDPVFHPFKNMIVNDGGGFTYAGYPTFYNVQCTFYKSDGQSGDGESGLLGGDPGCKGGGFFVQSGQTKSIDVTVLPGPANTSGRRIYIARTSPSPATPYYLAADIPGNAETTVHIEAPPGSPPTIPADDSQMHRRTIWIDGFDPEQGPPGTVARTVYRYRSGIAEQKIGEVLDNTWRPSSNWGEGVVDRNQTGDTIGTQAAAWRAIVVGKSNSPNTFADGITWQTVAPWGPVPEDWDHSYTYFQRVAILLLADGRVIVTYGNETGGVSARVRSLAGTWGTEQILLTNALYDYRLESLVLDGATIRCSIARADAAAEVWTWYPGTLAIDESDVLTLTLGAAVGSNFMHEAGKLTRVPKNSMVLLLGIDEGPSPHEAPSFIVTRSNAPLVPAIPASPNYTYSVTATGTVPGQAFAILGDFYSLYGIFVVRWRKK